MTLLSLDNICAAPWGSALLHDIHFELAAGEVLGILGPNGAGKSCLLNLLCGAITPTGGDYRFAGGALTDTPINQRARSIAVLPQQSTLNFPFTVEEVVQLGRTPHASGRDADVLIVTAALKATDTLHLRHRIYTQLSGGEKQRVQLARVFAQIWRDEDAAQRLLLLDEPTSALDLAHQQLVMEAVRDFARSGVAVVMILHDFNLASRYADQCVVLDNGRQVAMGAPNDIFTPTLFQRVFGVRTQVTTHPDSNNPLVIQL